jgi:hypothetical protein
MMDFAGMLANPIIAFTLRAALGAYIVYMARGFYADPMAYFRKWMPRMPEYPLIRRLIRASAGFCIWGGSFIFFTAIATQLLHFHGTLLAYALITLAALTTWLLLPRHAVPILDDDSGDDNMRRSK